MNGCEEMKWEEMTMNAGGIREERKEKKRK